MDEPNAMIVWLVAGKLHFCEATVISSEIAGLPPVGVTPSAGQLAPDGISTGDEAMDAAMTKLDALRMEELGITGGDIAETRPPAGPWEA